MISSALHTAFTAWYDELLIYAINRVRNEQDAQEIVQDSFLKLWRFEGDTKDRQRAFLWKAVKNAAIDILRHRQYVHKIITRPLIDEDWELAKEDEDLRRHQLEAMIMAKVIEATQTLPPTCRRVVEMSLIGKKTSEIMRFLHISRQNVLNQKARGIKLLRQKLYNQ